MAYAAPQFRNLAAFDLSCASSRIVIHNEPLSGSGAALGLARIFGRPYPGRLFFD